jgi:hypothetical protein
LLSDTTGVVSLLHRPHECNAIVESDQKIGPNKSEQMDINTARPEPIAATCNQ